MTLATGLAANVAAAPRGRVTKPPMHACTTAQRWVAQPSHSCHPALVYTAGQHHRLPTPHTSQTTSTARGLLSACYTHTGVENSTPAKVTAQALQHAEHPPPRQPPFTRGGNCWHCSMYLHLPLPRLPSWQLARLHINPLPDSMAAGPQCVCGRACCTCRCCCVSQPLGTNPQRRFSSSLQLVAGAFQATSLPSGTASGVP